MLHTELKRVLLYDTFTSLN